MDQEQIIFCIQQAADECCLPTPKFNNNTVTIAGAGIGVCSFLVATIGHIKIEVLSPEFSVPNDAYFSDSILIVRTDSIVQQIAVWELIDTLQRIKNNSNWC